MTGRSACQPAVQRVWQVAAEKDKAREERLAAALRENLRRRKAAGAASLAGSPEAD